MMKETCEYLIIDKQLKCKETVSSIQEVHDYLHDVHPEDNDSPSDLIEVFELKEGTSKSIPLIIYTKEHEWDDRILDVPFIKVKGASDH